MPPPHEIPARYKAQVDRIVEAIVYLYTEARRLTKDAAASFGLTGPQLSVVKILDGIGDLSLSDLSDRIRAQNSTVTGIVDRMEREGLVDRKRSEEDRRVVRIHLTEKGRRLARSLRVEPFDLFRGALDEALTAHELETLLGLLDKLAEWVRTRATRGNEDGKGSRSRAR